MPSLMLLDSPRFKLAEVVAWLEARTAEQRSKG
jgi:Tfp pilus assembly protein PilZ